MAPGSEKDLPTVGDEPHRGGVVSTASHVEDPGPLPSGMHFGLLEVIGKEAARLILAHYDKRKTLSVPQPIPESHELVGVCGIDAARNFADYCLEDAVSLAQLRAELRKVTYQEPGLPRRRLRRMPEMSGGAARMRAEAPDPKLLARVAKATAKPKKPRKPSPRQLLALLPNRRIAEAITANQKAHGSMRTAILAHRFSVPESKIKSVWALMKKARAEEPFVVQDDG